MADLATVERLAAADHNLAVIAVPREDGSVHASVVSAGVLPDPADGAPAVGLVAMGGSVKLGLFRRSGRATVVVKDGFLWAAVSGAARLVGPDDGTELGLD